MRFFRLIVTAFLLVALSPLPSLAQASSTSTVAGKVIDASTGLGIAGATVVVVGAPTLSATTDVAGAFRITGVPAGLRQVEIRRAGYETVDSDEFTATSGTAATITLALQSVTTTGSNGTAVIGRTSTRASESLQKSSVVYKDITATTIEHEGYYRAGDYLRTLPGINANGGSETPTPGDDLYLDVRGVGPQDTVTLIDGHPIAYGHKRGNNLGYNYDLSPTFALRDVQVTYGSGGSDLIGVSAIGGTVDMRTIDTTDHFASSFSQAYGTYANLVSAFSVTGPISKNLTFAIAGGVQGRNGYFRHASFFQPTAAYDASAPVGSADYNSGIYQDDSSVVNRGGLVKLRYAFGNPADQMHFTVHALSQYFWDDKTGNGDDDYNPYDTQLAIGNNLLASPPTPPAGITCAPGTFYVTNPNGQANGFSRNGNPNGGVTCQTPQQYAAFTTGFAGTGYTWQAFTVQDYAARFDAPLAHTRFSIDAYTNNYAQTYDRTYALPYVATPGDVASWQNPRVSSTGFTINDEIDGTNNDIGFGYAYNNYSYSYDSGSPGTITYLPSPTVHEQATLVRDVFHPQGSHVVAYFNGAFKNSTITHTSYFDPRLAIVYSLTSSDVVRLAAGKTTSQPFATFVYTPLSLISPSGLVGNTICGALNAIGTGGNPNLLPERGVDEEVSYGHRFGGDSLIQATLYNTNVNNKIYGALVPVTNFSSSFLGDITGFSNIIAQACPGDPRSQLGVSVSANVGHLISRGVDLAGRARATRNLFFDYDYSIESAFVASLPVSVLQNNFKAVPNVQLPTVPIHKYNVAGDYSFRNGPEFRLTYYYVGINNPKNAPAYNYSNVQVTSAVGRHAVFSVAVNNAFNQYADIRGRLGEGVPLPLNQFATNYTPLVGQGSTELYGLPYRSVLLTLSLKSR